MTVEEIERFIEAIRRDPALRRRVVEALFSEGFLQLPQAIERLGEEVRKLAEMVERLAERQERFEERQAQLEAILRRFMETTERRLEEVDRRLEVLETRLHRVETRLDRVETRLDRVETRLGRVEGWGLEDRYHRQAYAYFGSRLRRIRVVSKADLEEMFGDRVSPEDLEELFHVDLVLRACPKEDRDQQIYVVLEISSTVDLSDIERALRRAQVLRRTGCRCVAGVGGLQLTAAAREEARKRRVALAIDGVLSGWEEALSAA